jgi:hypothetical protein
MGHGGKDVARAEIDMRGASRAEVFDALLDMDAVASEHGGFVFFSTGANGSVAGWSALADHEHAISDVGFIERAPGEQSALTLQLGEDRYLVPLRIPERELDGMPALHSPTESADEFLVFKALDEEYLMPALASLKVEEELVSLRFPDRAYFIAARGWRRAIADSRRRR